ncbi:metallophosphoesterase [Tsuneonella sp. SYSU-LHT278]|uniref:metallophosphoesterase n=1 Tax=Tsuneonella sediminis TaxID=3416089 RepID=UPI003F7A09FF
MERAKGKPRTIVWMLVASGLLLGLAARAWHDTTGDPVVRRLTATVPVVDGDRTPRRIVLLSDIHVGGPDMPPRRLARIVRQVNALHPDMVLFAGDFVTDRSLATRRYSTRESVAPLARIDPDAVKLAVPGNHDHWRSVGQLERELQRVGIGLLRNEVVDIGGLLVGGIDDSFTGRAAVTRVTEEFAAHGRGGVVLSHSPDPFPNLPTGTGLMLSGHTHCGQIAWPGGGAPVTNSRYGNRYACGVVREGANTLVTSAGIGTSLLPFRLFTRAEVWVIDLQPRHTKTAAGSLRRP